MNKHKKKSMLDKNASETDSLYSHCLAKQLALRSTRATTASLNMVFTVMSLMSIILFVRRVHVWPPVASSLSEHKTLQDGRGQTYGTPD